VAATQSAGSLTSSSATALGGIAWFRPADALPAVLTSQRDKALASAEGIASSQSLTCWLIVRSDLT
jgi:hypothetical protein